MPYAKGLCGRMGAWPPWVRQEFSVFSNAGCISGKGGSTHQALTSAKVLPNWMMAETNSTGRFEPVWRVRRQKISNADLPSIVMAVPRTREGEPAGAVGAKEAVQGLVNLAFRRSRRACH